MRRNSLRLARPLEHKQLRKNSNRFEIYRKGPQHLRHGKLVIENEGEDKTGCKQVLDLERVNGRVVRGATTGCISSPVLEYKRMSDSPEAELHEVEDVTAASDEEDLHDKIV